VDPLTALLLSRTILTDRDPLAWSALPHAPIVDRQRGGGSTRHRFAVSLRRAAERLEGPPVQMPPPGAPVAGTPAPPAPLP
jgi:hypothetical protein